MKVLVYEPGKDGHRPVYLRYIREAFAEAGCAVVTVTESYRDRPAALARLARDEGAEVIFVCTMDGQYGWLLRLGFRARLAGIRVAGIYYLFNNLHAGWKGWLWRGQLHGGALETIFVPDLMLERRRLGRLEQRVSFIADPWDRRHLREMDRAEALAACGLPDPQACVLLLFGEISARKGLAQVLAMLEQWDLAARPRLRILVAGRLTAEVQALLTDFFRRRPELKPVLHFESRWIAESEHGKFFSAASYLCALYPTNFVVSMSTVIRSFAVGRPVIVGQHGMIGEVVRKMNSGLVCDSTSVASVLEAVERAYDTQQLDRKGYLAMATAGRAVAERSELGRFKETLAGWVGTRQTRGGGSEIRA